MALEDYPGHRKGGSPIDSGLNWKPVVLGAVESGRLDHDSFMAIENQTQRSLQYLQALYSIFLLACDSDDIDEIVLFKLNDLVRDQNKRFTAHRFANLREMAEALIRWAGHFGSEPLGQTNISMLGQLVFALRQMRPNRSDIRILPLPEEIDFDFRVVEGRKETNPRKFDTLDPLMQQVVMAVADTYDYSDLDRELLFQFSIRLEQIAPQHGNMDHFEVVATLFQWLLDTSQSQHGTPSWQTVFLHLHQQRSRNQNLAILAQELGLSTQPTAAGMQDTTAYTKTAPVATMEKHMPQETTVGEVASSQGSRPGSSEQDSHHIEDELSRQPLDHLYRQLKEIEGELSKQYHFALSPHTFIGTTAALRTDERSAHEQRVASHSGEIARLSEKYARIESILRERFETEIFAPIINAVKNYTASHPDQLNVTPSEIFSGGGNELLQRFISYEFPLFQLWFRALLVGKRILSNSVDKAMDGSTPDQNKTLTITRASVLGALYRAVGVEIASMSWIQAGLRYRKQDAEPPYAIHGQAAPVADLFVYRNFTEPLVAFIDQSVARLREAGKDTQGYTYFTTSEQHILARRLGYEVEILGSDLNMKIATGTARILEHYNPAFCAFDYNDVVRLSSSSLSELKRYIQNLLEKVDSTLQAREGSVATDSLSQALEGVQFTLQRNLLTIENVWQVAQNREAQEASHQQIDADVQSQVEAIISGGAVDRLMWGRVNEDDKNATYLYEGKEININWPENVISNKDSGWLKKGLLHMFRQRLELSTSQLRPEEVKKKLLEFFDVRGLTLYTRDSEDGPNVMFEILQLHSSPSIQLFLLLEFVFSHFDQEGLKAGMMSVIGEDGVNRVFNLRTKMREAVETALRNHLTQEIKRRMNGA